MKTNIIRALLAFVLATAMMLAIASAAWGQSRPGYEGAAGTVQSDVETGGTLPFTGLDLGLLLGGGALLLVVGGTLRRLAREKR